MADFTLTAVLTANSGVTSGDPTSSFTITVDAHPEGVYGSLLLTLPTALVGGGTATITGISVLGSGPSTGPDGLTWKLGGRGGKATLGPPVAIAVAGITPAASGLQTITVSTSDSSGSSTATVQIQVAPAGVQPQITSFTATPQVLTWPADSPSPRPPVNLQWQIGASSTPQLFRHSPDITSPGISLDLTAPTSASDTGYSSGTNWYRLLATASNGDMEEQWQSVLVQSVSYGFFPSTLGQPTLLLADGNDALYGVFIQPNGMAALYSLAGTGRSGTKVADLPANVVATSPGVIFANQIWLLGGSQMEAGVCSNTVWTFDPANPSQPTCQTADWSPRMGHACVAFNNQLWVLGGQDATGATLRDVWYFDGKKWALSAEKLPQPLCMLTACAFTAPKDELRLYIYGGADSPAAGADPNRHGADPQPDGPPPNPGCRFNANMYCTTGSDADWITLPLSADDADLALPFASALFVNPATSHLAALGTYLNESKNLDIFGIGFVDSPHANVTIDHLTHESIWPSTLDSQTLQVFRLNATPFLGQVFVLPLFDGGGVPGATGNDIYCYIP